MKINNKAKSISAAMPKKRQPWVKPVIQKIKAGEAEVGTRSAADGAFTTS
jgi:hypothetical protein